jgi:hypothetical protein
MAEDVVCWVSVPSFHKDWSLMMDPDEYTEEASVTSRLMELAKDLTVLVETAPLEQRIRLLRVLEELRLGERRGHRRKPCSMRVTYATQDLLGREAIKDIGIGGLCLDTTLPLPVGQHITLMFFPPGKAQEINLPAEVVWAAGQGLGVKFAEPPNNELQALIESL